MELYEIKQGILNLKDIKFNRFQNWFDEIGYDRINKNAKSSKIRQSVLKLSEKDFNHFWDWFEDLCDEKWAEEVENDPIARKCLEIGNIIMSKPDPGKFLIDLLISRNEAKAKE